MTNQEMEHRLANAIIQSAPNDFEGVLSCCETRKGTIIQMTTRKKRPVFRNLIAACLALALIGGSTIYQQAYAVTSIVSLDINPSIELKVNQREKLLACTPLNEEAKIVLADMNGGADLKGAKLDVAVNAIVGALVRNGYLDNISSAILISVEDKDQSRAAKLQQELATAVDIVLQDRASDAAVLSQTVAKNTTLEKQAKAHQISTGKAALIHRIQSLNSALTFEKLAALSVEELKDLIEANAPGMPIGKETAARLAKEYAGVKNSDLVSAEVSSELDDIPAHYEVDLYLPEEFEYKVDAYSGKILQGRKNILPSSALSAPLSPSLEEPTESQTPPAPVVPSTPVSDSDSAVASALSHAGLTRSQVSALRVEKDEENRRLEYEIDFKAAGFEYEYTIDANTGIILEHEKDYDD